MTYLIFTDDGKIFPFNPAEWRYIVKQKDLEEGKYEPKFEQEVKGDKVEMRITQLMPPLVRVGQ